MDIERWSVDRLMEATVTLLRSRLEGLDQLEALARRLGVVELVSQLPSDVWSEEVEAVLERDAVQAFIQEGLGRGGQDRRAIREGDVFVIAADRALPPPEMARPERSAEFIERCRRARARVFDMTAAVRQAVKVTYGRVVEQAAPRPEPPSA